MNANDLPAGMMWEHEAAESTVSDPFHPLMLGDTRARQEEDRSSIFSGAVIGELLAITDDGATPLVRFAGQKGTAAIRARSSIDLHGRHIGESVVLMFEKADGDRPIVIGLLRGVIGWPIADKPAHVEVDADGERMVVIAKDQLVLRCGKASITLTKTGKVLIEGSYVLSRSTGVNRIKGGSVQLN